MKVLHINEELFEIDDCIDDIVSELLRSEEVAHYRAARDEFLADDVLQGKLALLQENLEFTSIRPELRDLKREINLNDKVYQLKLAENDLQELLSNLAKTLSYSISKHIFIDENLPLRGGGHHQRRKIK